MWTYTLWERIFKNACKFCHRFWCTSVANVEVIKILSNNECRKNKPLPCKVLLFCSQLQCCSWQWFVRTKFCRQVQSAVLTVFVISSVFQAGAKIMKKWMMTRFVPEIGCGHYHIPPLLWSNHTSLQLLVLTNWEDMQSLIIRCKFCT
jgi:hypothetical protein